MEESNSIMKNLEYILFGILAVVGSNLPRLIEIDNIPNPILAGIGAVVLGFVGYGIGKLIKKRK